MSEFKQKSEISKLNRYGNYLPIKVSKEVYLLIEKAVEYSKLTDGYFDITVKNLLNIWRESTDKNYMLPKEESEEALLSVGPENVKLLPKYRIKLKMVKDLI